MKRFPLIPTIVAIVAFALSVPCARRVETGRAELIANKDRVQRVYVPCMGMDKFIADLKWVMLIQDMGKVKGQLDENAARYFAKALDAITDLDPDLHKAYQMGGMFISNARPQDAISLLQKGRRYGLKDHWNLSYFSGFFAERFLPRVGQVPMSDCLKMAEQYYSESPFYVHHAWLRLATREAGEDAVAQLVAQKDVVLKMKPQLSDIEGMPEGSGADVYMGGMEMESSPYAVLSGRLVQRSASLARQLVEEQRQAQDPEYRKTLAEQLLHVRQVFDAFRPAGHACGNCCAQYSAGQFFCCACGVKVEPFGYCRTCWAQGKLVVLTGDFCHNCGTKSPEALKRAKAAEGTDD
jgi:hypothetical protein